MPFELMHLYLCGPMKHSIGGAHYYILYIDDCTRYTEVYFLITKTVEEISVKFNITKPGWKHLDSTSNDFAVTIDLENTATRYS